MKVFVTGAAGFIGKATVRNLLAHGHTVLGLSRNDKNAEILKSLGAEVLKGDLTDFEALKKGASSTDGTIHLAFVHDFSDYEGSCKTGAAAVSAMLEVLKGTDKPFVLAAGTFSAEVPPGGKPATEDSPNLQGPPFGLRSAIDELVLSASKDGGVRGTVIRLPPTVHAEGTGGLIGAMFDIYKAKGGPVLYVGEGQTRWGAGYRDDAAELFRLALEKGRAGATYHAVDEEGIPLKEQIEMVARVLKTEATSVSVDEAAGALGMLAHMMLFDNPCSSEKTKKELGWNPSGPKLIPDFENSLA